MDNNDRDNKTAKQTENNKQMAIVSLHLLKMNLKLNGLNSPTKGHRLGKRISLRANPELASPLCVCRQVAQTLSSTSNAVCMPGQEGAAMVEYANSQ